MSASTTEMNRTVSAPKQQVVQIPYPNEAKLHVELESLFKQEFDAAGRVEYIRGYYFFRSTQFQPNRKINRSGNPYHGQIYDDLLRKINFKELDKEHRQALLKVGKDEYKIHLTLSANYEIPVLKLIFQFFKTNSGFLKLLYCIKIAKNPRCNYAGQVFPDIVIYPILGQENAKTLWTGINAFFSSYDVNKLGSGYVPRFSKVENPLITYAQFGGDIKNAMSAEERKKYLTLSQVHFSDDIASQDPHLLISPRQLSACKKTLKMGDAAKNSPPAAAFATTAPTAVPRPPAIAAATVSGARDFGAAAAVAAATTNTVVIGSNQDKDKEKEKIEVEQKSASDSQPTQPIEELSPTQDYHITPNVFPVPPPPIQFSASVLIRKRKADTVTTDVTDASTVPAAGTFTPAPVKVAPTAVQKRTKTLNEDTSSFDKDEGSVNGFGITQRPRKKLKRSHTR